MKKILALSAIIALIGLGAWIGTRTSPAEAPDSASVATDDHRNSETTNVSDNRTLSLSKTSNTENRPKTAENVNLRLKESIKKPTKQPKEKPTESWVDPTNQRVLGPKSWMAKADEKEKQRIADTFTRNASRMKNRVNASTRQNSIEAMRTAVTACLEEYREINPEATGRVIVSWNAQGAKSGVGKVSDVSIDTNMGLRDETFESCVTSVDGLRFEGEIGRNIRVEYPFMFDEIRNNPE